MRTLGEILAPARYPAVRVDTDSVRSTNKHHRPHGIVVENLCDEVDDWREAASAVLASTSEQWIHDLLGPVLNLDWDEEDD